MRVNNKTKFTVAFLGTDGSGKSTIINEITPIIQKRTGMKVYYEHMRPNYLPSLGVALGKRTREEEKSNGPVKDPHASRPSGFCGSFLRLCYYLIDYTYGYYKKIYPSYNIFWIFDRYFYDLQFDQRRARISLPLWIIKLSGKIVPQPDLIICLGGNANILFSRKPETSFEEVSRQVKELQYFCLNRKNAVWIDTAHDLETSVNETLTVIHNMMARKTSKVG